MAVTANEDRLNLIADMEIMREMVAYLVAWRLDTDGGHETGVLIERISGNLNKALASAAESSEQYADTQKRRYEARLRLVSEAINNYRSVVRSPGHAR
jgi:hypothetical protein